MTVDPTWTVDEVMNKWPATIRVFLAHRMGCIGCPIGPFHSLVDAAQQHSLPLDSFLGEIESAIVSSEQIR